MGLYVPNLAYLSTKEFYSNKTYGNLDLTRLLTR